MEISDFKNKIQFAMEIVKDIPEPYKIKAFEITLSYLLDAEVPKIKNSVTVSNPPNGNSISETGLEQKIQKFAEIINVLPNQLNDIFKFDENGAMFIGKIEGTESEKQVYITRLILLVAKEIYDKEWMDGSFLWGILKDYGVGSLDNLSKSLNKFPSDFRSIGQKRGRKYRLTEAGRQTAIALLKKQL